MGELRKEWKNVLGYEKFYKVSNYGEVKAKRRVIYGKSGGEIQPLYITEEHYIQPFDNGFGYLQVSLSDENTVKKNYYIHRLVAIAFIPNPDNLPQVNHIDYDRKNNKVTNLEWCTALDNTRHSLCHMSGNRRPCHSSTGYKYIYYKKNGGYYRVKVSSYSGSERLFKTLEKAIEYRDLIVKEIGIECEDNID